LKHAIHIRTFADWDDAMPGFVEVDLVAHCAESTHGEYLNSLTLTDITTTWTECLAIRNRSQHTVHAAIVQARTRLPFPLLGLDSDNGTEFINDLLLRYCQQEQLTFTRSPPYKKNDQAHVEQKNWSIVLQTVGYDRDVGQRACEALAVLYEVVRLYTSFFQPRMKLQSKKEI
jgi:IS30 family transposase